MQPKNRWTPVVAFFSAAKPIVNNTALDPKLAVAEKHIFFLLYQ